MTVEHPTAEELSRYHERVRGGCSASLDLDDIRSHLDQCPRCIAFIEHLEENLNEGNPIPLLAFREDAPIGDDRAGMVSSSFGSPVHGPFLGDLSDEDVSGALRCAASEYVIDSVLGRGSNGTVYLATQKGLARPVALKVLRSRRFNRELLAAGRMRHENVVATFDAFVAGGMHFLVMELIQGVDLERFVGQRGPLNSRRACLIAIGLAKGLRHLHQNGVIHRDLKPSNVMLSRRAGPKILDFGLSRLLETDLPTVTDDGFLVGTLAYMAPEQLRGAHRVDHRADLFSLGCVLYYMLSAKHPFLGDNFVRMLAERQTAVPPPLSRARRDLPDGLEAVVNKLMALDPSERYQSASEVLAALQPFGTRARRLGSLALIDSPPGSAAQLGGLDSGLPIRDISVEQHLAPRSAPIALASWNAAGRTAMGTALVASFLGFLWLVQAQNLSRRTGEIDSSGEREKTGAARAIAAERPIKTDAAKGLDQIDRLSGHKGSILSLSLSPDGQTLASASGWFGRDDRILFWRVGARRRGQAHPAGEILEPGGVASVGWSPDGKYLLSGRSDGLVRLWRLGFNKSRGAFTATEERTYEGHEKYAQVVLFNRDGTKGISASFDKTIRLFDLQTGAKLHRFEHEDWVFCAALVGAKQLLSGSKDHTLRLWDLDTGARLLSIDAGAEVRGCAISPDGRMAAAACTDEAIRLFELQSGTPAGSYKGHTDSVVGVAFSPSGKYLLSGGCDGRAILWSATGRVRPIASFSHPEFIMSLAFGKDDGVGYFGGGVRKAPARSSEPYEQGSDFDIHVLRLPVGGPQAGPATESGRAKPP